MDGSSVGDVTESSLKDRRILGDEGFISVIVVVDTATGKVAGRPGDPRPRLRRATTPSSTQVDPAIEGALEDAPPTGVVDMQQLRRSSGGPSASGSSDTYRRRPMIIPVVVEV